MSTPGPEVADPLDWPLSVLYELPYGVVILDWAGEPRLVTRHAEELLGDAFEEITAAVSELVGSGGTEARRFELQHANGAQAVIEASATEVRRSGELLATILTFEDASARERRARAERDFVTNAAHELQTPLASITSAVEVLQAGAKDTAADRDRFLAHLERACRRLERLTRALLVLARAQTGSEQPRREIVPVAMLLQAVAEGLAPGREIEVDCASDVAVLANRPLLEEALTNLGQNAVKHSRGPIELIAARVSDHVRIQVRDRGTGISENDRERVFDRFYRGDAPTGGFGLGLAIVAEAVKAIDGELELETSPSGTSVSIRLPGARIVSA